MRKAEGSPARGSPVGGGPGIMPASPQPGSQSNPEDPVYPLGSPPAHAPACQHRAPSRLLPTHPPASIGHPLKLPLLPTRPPASIGQPLEASCPRTRLPAWADLPRGFSSSSTCTLGPCPSQWHHAQCQCLPMTASAEAACKVLPVGTSWP